MVHVAHSVREDSPFLPKACKGSTMHFVPGQWENPLAPGSSWATALTLHLMSGRKGGGEGILIAPGALGVRVCALHRILERGTHST